MSAFSSLPFSWQTVIPLILLAEAILELGLFMYLLLRSNRRIRSFPCMAHFIILIILLFSITQGDPDEGKDAFLLGAPWLLFLIVIILVTIHFTIAFPREYRRRKNELSPTSIKEATDKLPMGICFSNPEGRIVLCNNLFRHLSFSLCGQELQVMKDLDFALEKPDKTVRIKNDCYILPDKTVWQFQKQTIVVDGDNRWIQMTAHNVTELYHGNLRQAEINRELKKVNQKLQEMYEHMADDIREKESLDLKIYIHDTIGRSLLTIRDIIDNNEDTDRKIKALQKAVEVLSSNRILPYGTLDEVIQSAKTLGVTVKTEGYLPNGSVAEELTVAAARECVTNCIKHAGGNEVSICVSKRNNLYDITITNNGSVPTKPIKEGSGLSSLRRSIEAAEGEMHTAYKPRFALLITLPGKEHVL